MSKVAIHKIQIVTISFSFARPQSNQRLIYSYEEMNFKILSYLIKGKINENRNDAHSKLILKWYIEFEISKKGF